MSQIEPLIKGEQDWHLRINQVITQVNNSSASSTLQAVLESTGYGVLNGLDIQAQSTPDMTINITSGVVYLEDGTRVESNGNSALLISDADTTNPRIDIIYVDTEGTIGYLAGTPAVSPIAPSLPTGAFLLSEINVGANVLSISNENIVDKRKIKSTLDSVSADLSDIVQKQDKFTEDANGKLLYNGAKVGATKASELTLEAIVGMTATDVQAGIAEAFQYASNGKTTIAGKVGNVTGSNTHAEIANEIQSDKNTMATNITSKGISASGTETLASLSSKVGQISLASLGGVAYASGSVYSSSSVLTGSVSLPFTPRVIFMQMADRTYSGLWASTFCSALGGSWGQTSSTALTKDTTSNQSIKVVGGTNGFTWQAYNWGSANSINWYAWA